MSATNLGLQYVFMNNEACSHLQFVDRLYLCEKEKEFYKKERNKMLNESRELSKLAKIEYRRKGKYFDELFPTE